MIYIFNIIQLLDGNMIDKDAILEMILTDNLFNSFSFTDEVRLVEILYFSINIVSIKQYVDLELTKTQKARFWIQSGLQTRGNVRSKVSKFGLERVIALRQIELVVIQTMSIQLTFCTEFVKLYSSFPTEQSKLFLHIWLETQ